MKMEESDDMQLSKLKDFLKVYNDMADRCFKHCINNFNYRDITSPEEQCIENCSTKSVRVNHRLMMSFVEEQPEIAKKRSETNNMMFENSPSS